MRNDTFPGFVNPQNQQQMPQYMANNNYPHNYQMPPQLPPVPNAYPQPSPNYPIASDPNNYPLPQNSYQPAPQHYPAVPNYPVLVTPNFPPQPQPVQHQIYPQPMPNVPIVQNGPIYTTPTYEIATQPPTVPATSTTTIRAPVYSKYVCGVKGTSRTTRKMFLERIAPDEQRSARQRRDIKSNERLILGSELIPIQIGTDKLGDFAKELFRMAADRDRDALEAATAKVPQIVYNTNYTSYSRRARVVGGEDGENGEWCWQVALINSMNQYLCGAALIGTQWVLTAAHCVTK